MENSLIEAVDYNAQITAWGQRTRQRILFSLASLGLVERAKVFHYLRKDKVAMASLMKSVKITFRKNDLGRINKATISYNYYEIFLARGAGRGGKRQAHDVIKPIVEEELLAIAKIVESSFGHEFLNTIADKITE